MEPEIMEKMTHYLALVYNINSGVVMLKKLAQFPILIETSFCNKRLIICKYVYG